LFLAIFLLWYLNMFFNWCWFEKEVFFVNLFLIWRFLKILFYVLNMSFYLCTFFYINFLRTFWLVEKLNLIVLGYGYVFPFINWLVIGLFFSIIILNFGLIFFLLLKFDIEIFFHFRNQLNFYIIQSLLGLIKFRFNFDFNILYVYLLLLPNKCLTIYFL
jgi:hypothetical protein